MKNLTHEGWYLENAHAKWGSHGALCDGKGNRIYRVDNRAVVFSAIKFIIRRIVRYTSGQMIGKVGGELYQFTSEKDIVNSVLWHLNSGNIMPSRLKFFINLHDEEIDKFKKLGYSVTTNSVRRVILDK